MTQVSQFTVLNWIDKNKDKRTTTLKGFWTPKRLNTFVNNPMLKIALPISAQYQSYDPEESRKGFGKTFIFDCGEFIEESLLSLEYGEDVYCDSCGEYDCSHMDNQ